MKIAITHTDFRIYWPARLKALSRELSAQGHEIDIIEIAGKGSPYFFSENNLANKNWMCLFPNDRMEDIIPKKASSVLYNKLDELNPDVVIAGAIAFPSGATAVRWAKKRNKGVVIFDDAKIEDVGRSRITNFIKKRIYGCVDAVFCPSPEWNETYQFWGLKQSQLFYGVDVVDNDFWQKKELKEGDYALPENYILTVGRQIGIKNFPFLIQAFSEYKKVSGSSIALVFVGEGSERELLEKLVHENSVSDVYFYPFLSQEELKIIYKSAELFVLPSFGETWGLVVNEAMACSLPVAISDRVGCSTTLIKNNINGYVFSLDNTSGLINILNTFLSKSNSDKNKMKKAALDEIAEWGLSRFVQGAIDAALYANQHKKNNALFDSLILRFWHGRYNPI